MEIVEYGVIEPLSVVMHRSSAGQYGRVPGIPDGELADPHELERQVYLEEFGPIWAVPVKARSTWIRPTVDEDGDLEWGAFGTIDFERLREPFDKARYKADKLREELKDVVIRLSIVNDRIKDRRKYLILKHVRMGVLDLDQIVDPDMWSLVRLYLRARRMRKEIRELAEVSHRRRSKAPAWLASV